MRYTTFLPATVVALSLLGGLAAHAQTTGTGSTGTTGTTGTVQGTGTVGTPNTGAGGSAPANFIALAASAAVLAAGATYLLRTRRS